MEVLKHSWFGPSSFHRLLYCTASYAACEDIEEQPSGYADEGNCAHYVGSDTLIEGGECKDRIGQVHFGVEVDMDMAYYTQKYVNAIRKQVADEPDAVLFVEKQVGYERWVPDGYGTSDSITIYPAKRKAIINDLKFGKGTPVSAEDNEQGLGYGLGVLDTYGHIYDIEEYEIRIWQPRINFDEPSVWSVTREELLDFGRRCREAAFAIKKGDVKFHPGEKICQWCKAKNPIDRPPCKAHAEWLMGKIGLEFEDIKDSKPLPTLDEMSTAQMVGAFLHKEALKKWLDGIAAYVNSAMDQGVEFPGLKRVLGGRRTRFWKDAKAAEDMMRNSMQIKIPLMYKQTLISPAQAEKVLGPRQWDRISELVDKTELKPIVVPVDDKREAIPGVAAEFDYDDDTVETSESSDGLDFLN